MTGFRGQKFEFTGEDGGYYAVISDFPHLHMNMVSRDEFLRKFRWVSNTTDHRTRGD